MTELMTPREVADLFRVHVRTVAMWARDGRLRTVRSPGGQWRFLREDVEALLAPTQETAQ